MKLRTEIKLKSVENNQIDYNSRVLMFGSCFVENIGEKLNYFKFRNTVNPFGILFHPKAIENLVVNAVNEKEYTENDIFFHNEQWHCFDAHSKLSNLSKEDLLEDLNNAVRLTSQQLRDATHIIFTLGTSWVYRFLENDLVVANCHKVPQKAFKKELLSVDAIKEILLNTVSKIRTVNTQASIVFTVSPVRHIKDGFVENTQSKSHLIAAIHQLLNIKSSIVNCQSSYFPSYEIMMDELRDYRFYNEDMLHPNTTAINFIWEKFQHVWITSKAADSMRQVDVIQKGLKHRPFNPNAKAHQDFLHKLNSKIESLKTKYAFISFKGD